MPKNEGAEVRVEDEAQKKAKELGVDPANIVGSGQEGAVSVQDVERHAAQGEGGKDVEVVTLDPNYGVGEVAVNVEGERVATVLSGVDTPLSKKAADALKDKDGEYRYPVVKKEDG